MNATTITEAEMDERRKNVIKGETCVLTNQSQAYNIRDSRASVSNQTFTHNGGMEGGLVMDSDMNHIC